MYNSDAILQVMFFFEQLEIISTEPFVSYCILSNALCPLVATRQQSSISDAGIQPALPNIVWHKMGQVIYADVV